jgi:hypothetical protein
MSHETEEDVLRFHDKLLHSRYREIRLIQRSFDETMNTYEYLRKELFNFSGVINNKNPITNCIEIFYILKAESDDEDSGCLPRIARRYNDHSGEGTHIGLVNIRI